MYDGMYFTDDVMLEKNFLLMTSITPVTEKFIGALRNWNFEEVYSNGTINKNFQLSKTKTKTTMPVKPEVSAAPVKEEKHFDFFPAIENIDSANNEEERIELVKGVYNEYMKWIDSLFTRYATHRELDQAVISERIKEMCIYIKNNRNYILRIQPELEIKNNTFLISHTMRSTVYALVIGMQLRLPMSKLIELGVATILHELGMIRLPPQLYMTDKPLTLAEKKALFTHPVLGYNILKDKSFPLNICLGVLEHHEKENGEGYPRKLTGDRISLYAKIISVVCSFEAVTAPRKHREAYNEHEGILEMLKNTGKQYDDTVVRTLINVLSLYPIGSHVLLSDNRIALVTDSSPSSPKFPTVQLIAQTNSDGTPVVLQTAENGIHIVRSLTKKEVEALSPKKEQKQEGTTPSDPPEQRN
jgi:HD-GYP domain-containing protein (c-di-GMP phosphodiesterase class II)